MVARAVNRALNSVIFLSSLNLVALSLRWIRIDTTLLLTPKYLLASPLWRKSAIELKLYLTQYSLIVLVLLCLFVYFVFIIYQIYSE